MLKPTDTKPFNLPPHLAPTFVVCNGEGAWTRGRALALIEYLTECGCAVLGYEIWIPEGPATRVVAFNPCKPEFTGNWKKDVSNANAEAASKIRAEPDVEGILFNLSWVDEEGFGELSLIQQRWTAELTNKRQSGAAAPKSLRD